MSYKWHQLEEGIRVREHPTRKHGIRPDIYYVIRYQRDGKRQEEALGWASEGMTLQKARLELTRLKEAARTGHGPASLREKRLAAEAERKASTEAAAQASREAVTFSDFWDSIYWPAAQHHKASSSLRSEDGLYRKWLKPAIGNMALKDILPGHLEAVVNDMLRLGRAPRTAQYAMAVVSQVWNSAYSYGLLHGENPVRRTKKPRVDNRRMRFLTREEAAALLRLIRPRSQSLYDSCLLSLFCGLRAGEIHALRWGDINFEAGEIFIRDPKNGYNRYAYMTTEIRAMLRRRYTGQARSELVFPSVNGKLRAQASKLFETCVAELGLNDGYDDRRQRIVFHSLRHTFASWHVEQGTPLFQVGALMGHRSPQMTQRYSHLSPDSARRAALTLEGTLQI